MTYSNLATPAKHPRYIDTNTTRLVSFISFVAFFNFIYSVYDSMRSSLEFSFAFFSWLNNCFASGTPVNHAVASV